MRFYLITTHTCYCGEESYYYDKVKDENTDIADNIFNEKWKFVDEAFKEVFGVDRHLA